MDRPNHLLREAAKALTFEEAQGSEHPSTIRLLAYHRGEIAPGEAAMIRQHLSLCADCAAVALDAVDFFPDDEDEEVGSAESEAAWQKLHQALETGEERPPSLSPILPPPSPPKRSLVRSLSFAYGLAAAFAALSISLIVLRGSTPSPEPRTNIGLYDLTAVGIERGEGDRAEVRSIHFRSLRDAAFLILNPAIASHSARHGVRIRRADGTLVWRSEDLRPQESGGFHLSLPAGALPAGRYSIELYGINQGKETPLGIYPIVVEK